MWHCGMVDKCDFDGVKILGGTFNNIELSRSSGSKNIN